MATFPQPFNPAEYDPSGGPQGLPISDDNGHLVQIVDSKWVPTRDNPNNGRLVFSLKILDGSHAGHVGDYGFNLYHTNPQTVEIARSELSALCYVIGVFNPVSDTNILHNKQFRAYVRQQKKSPQFTEVWKVTDLQGRTGDQVRDAGPGSLPQQAPAAPLPQAAHPAATYPAAVPAAPVAPAAPMAPPAPPALPQAPAPAPAMPAPPAAPAAPPAALMAHPAGPAVVPPPAAPGMPAAPGSVPPWEQ